MLDDVSGELPHAPAVGRILVKIEEKDVDRHPSSLVFFTPHEDAPFSGFLARQIADE